MKKKIIIVAIFFLLILSNVVLFYQALEQKKKFDRLRLSPLSLYSYPSLNTKTEHLIYGDSHAYYWKNFPYESKNYGIGGQTSRQIFLRSGFHLPKEHLQEIYLFCGSNDLKCLFTTGKSERFSIEEIMFHIESLIEKYKQQQIHLFTIPPIFSSKAEHILMSAEDFDVVRKKVNQKILKLNLKYKNVAVYDVDEIFKGKALSSLSYDGAHMNEGAYALINAHLKLKSNAN